MPTSDLEYTSFLIRLWREPPNAGEPQAAGREWLGQGEHIPDGKKEYFSSLEDLFAFIRAQLPGVPVGEEAGGQGSMGAEEQRGG